jgi:isocitrate/isopropylmalate dehydrogenase
MPTQNNRLRIATLPGDGIGREIVPAALHIVGIVEKAVGGFALDVEERLDMGALYHHDSGETCRRAPSRRLHPLTPF